MSVELVFEHILQRRERGELTTETAKGQRNVLLAFFRSCGVPASDVTKKDVENYLQTLRVKTSTKQGRLSTLRNFFGWLSDENIITVDPTLRVRVGRPPRAMPRAISDVDVQRLFGVCSRLRDELVISLMVQEGLRCCEVASLDRAHIDMVDRIMLVRGKGGSERILPISDETHDLLVRYLNETREVTRGPLVRSSRNTRYPLTPEHLSELVAQLFAQAGVKLMAHDGRSAHALRHTAATDLLRAPGATIRDVQQFLGHASLTSTERYLAWGSVERLRGISSGRTYRAS